MAAGRLLAAGFAVGLALPWGWELLLGPRRFNQLLDGLPGISTDILTTRLRSLGSVGVVRRTGTGRQGCELTSTGQTLRPILRELARWGAGRTVLPGSIDAVPTRLAPTALLLLPTSAPSSIEGCFEVRADGETARLAVGRGTTTVLREEDAASPVATIELTHTGRGQVERPRDRLEAHWAPASKPVARPAADGHLGSVLALFAVSAAAVAGGSAPRRSASAANTSADGSLPTR